MIQSPLKYARPTSLVAWVATLLVALLASGCSRSQYRTAADFDAQNLVRESSHLAQWPQDDFSIDVDPQSRMFDLFDPDFPPMPPDDPDSHELMHCVDCKPGYPCWHANGDAPHFDGPLWQESLPRDENGVVTLDIRTAVDAALLHSPQYQQEMETLYLSALDVSAERFRFDAQFFGGYETFFDTTGSDGGSTSELTAATRGFTMTKLYASGGELVVGAANSLIWQFSGTNTHTATTLLDFSLVQPLLRGGGRDVVLEHLTRSERNLVANVRQTERFRRGFYADVVTGLGDVGGPSRAARGIGGVAGGTGGGQAGGYLGLLQTSKEVKNQESNVLALRDSLNQLEFLLGAGRIDPFQVNLARQALFDGQSRLLTSMTGYETRLDNYKIALGLPPDLPLNLSDPLVEQFDLIAPEMRVVQDAIADLLDRARTADGNLDAATYASVIAEAQSILTQVQTQANVVHDDLTKLETNLPARREALRQLLGRPELIGRDVDTTPLEPAELDRRMANDLEEFDRFQTFLADAIASFETLQNELDRAELVEWLTNLSAETLQLSLTQASIRLDSIVLVPVEMESPTALEIARCYRLDWKNARASLVDSWRLIQFTANDLESNLDIVFSGDISNVGDNPIKLRDNTGRLSVGLEWDAPLTRLGERNTYRESLIDFQQTRRDYYQFVDLVNRGLRQTLRNIEVSKLNFEIRRAAVHLAISQVELARLRLEEPPKPGAKDSSFGDSTVRDLVQALQNLLNAQNDILSVWVSYDVLRIALDLNLGTMQLDEQGHWVDPGEITVDSLGWTGSCPTARGNGYENCLPAEATEVILTFPAESIEELPPPDTIESVPAPAPPLEPMSLRQPASVAGKTLRRVNHLEFDETEARPKKSSAR